jgi:hypothetical protein
MENKKSNTQKIQQILFDMAKCTPVEVYRKHGVGLQTQVKIKESVVFWLFDEIAEKNCCYLCSLKLLK